MNSYYDVFFEHQAKEGDHDSANTMWKKGLRRVYLKDHPNKRILDIRHRADSKEERNHMIDQLCKDIRLAEEYTASERKSFVLVGTFAKNRVFTFTEYDGSHEGATFRITWVCSGPE